MEVRHDKTLFILDAGTGIRELGNSLLAKAKGGPIEGHIFITHTHWDHIQGFPFFIPAYIKGNHFQIYGPHGIDRSFEKVLRALMDPDYFPVDVNDMASTIEFKEVRGPWTCEGVRIKTHFTNHPGMDLAYRFEFGARSVTYVTDHETYQAMHKPSQFAEQQDKAMEDFCRGTDLLICDAQYTEEEYRAKKTWGHSQFQDTVKLALAAGVKRLALFHHDPAHTDEKMEEIGRAAKRIVAKSGKKMECLAAREGLEIKI